MYVKVACATFTTLLSCAEGREYQFFVELIDEILSNVLMEIGKEGPGPGAALSPGPGGNPRTGRTDSNEKDDDKSNGAAPGTPSHRKSIMKIPIRGVMKSGLRSYRPLSRVNVTRKLAREYFTLIGILSQSSFGLTYFDRMNLYDNLYSLHKDSSYVPRPR
jgi:hypothetical protein